MATRTTSKTAAPKASKSATKTKTTRTKASKSDSVAASIISTGAAAVDATSPAVTNNTVIASAETEVLKARIAELEAALDVANGEHARAADAAAAARKAEQGANEKLQRAQRDVTVANDATAAARSVNSSLRSLLGRTQPFVEKATRKWFGDTSEAEAVLQAIARS